MPRIPRHKTIEPSPCLLKNYDLILNNCDETVTRIFSAGGINMYSRIIPNITYKEELERAINKKMIELITEAWK